MEKIGLELVFEEIRTRGEDKYFCVLRAIEEGSVGCQMEETMDTVSWEKLKEDYPTLRDILVNLFVRFWKPTWPDDGRALFIKSVSGHEGLYDFDKKKGVEVDWDEIRNQ